MTDHRPRETWAGSPSSSSSELWLSSWSIPTTPPRVNPTNEVDRRLPGVEAPTIVVDRESAGATMSPDWQLLDRGPLSPRWPAVIAWTDEELVIWGGTVFRGAADLRDGAATTRPRTPGDDRPSPLGTVRGAQSLWTGNELVVRRPTEWRPRSDRSLGSGRE